MTDRLPPKYTSRDQLRDVLEGWVEDTEAAPAMRQFAIKMLWEDLAPKTNDEDDLPEEMPDTDGMTDAELMASLLAEARTRYGRGGGTRKK